MDHVTNPHNDTLVLTTENNDFNIKSIQVDSGNSTIMDIWKVKKDLKKADFPLVEFARKTIYPLEAIHLHVVLGKSWKTLRSKITLRVRF